MGKYSIELKKSVFKDFDSIPRKDLQRIILAIKSLADDPRPPQSKKLSGLEQYRLRQGNACISTGRPGKALFRPRLLLENIAAVAHVFSGGAGHHFIHDELAPDGAEILV